MQFIYRRYRPLVVFSKVQAPDIALASLLIAIVGLGIVVAGFVMRRQRRLRHKGWYF